MKKRSFRLNQFGLLVLVIITGLLSAASIHQIGWSAAHSADFMLFITVSASLILSGFMITLFILSLRFYRLSIEEKDLKGARRTVLSHIQERLATIRTSKTAILVIGMSLLLLTLPILRFITYDSKGLAAVCYVKAVQSNLLVFELLDELGSMILVEGVPSVSARDVRGVQSDCEEPTDQEVAVTIYEQGMQLAPTQNWTRAVIEGSGYEWVKNEQFYPYGKAERPYPISYIADTFTSEDRQLRVEYFFESNVNCDKEICEEAQAPLAKTKLKYVFATLSLKS